MRPVIGHLIWSITGSDSCTMHPGTKDHPFPSFPVQQPGQAHVALRKHGPADALIGANIPNALSCKVGLQQGGTATGPFRLRDSSQILPVQDPNSLPYDDFGPGLIGPCSGIFLASLKFKHKENGNAVTPGISQRTKRPHNGANVKPGTAAGTAKPRAPECVNQSTDRTGFPRPARWPGEDRVLTACTPHRVTGSVLPTVSAAWHAANHLHRSPA